MGCVQAKPHHSMNSPPTGLDKLKLESGYYAARAKGGSEAHRRSTGQRSTSSGSSRGEVMIKKLVPIEEKRDGLQDGGDGDGLVDGWPKWLTDNVPREVLAGLVPKSADNYDKIDKVGQGTYSNVYKARDRNTGKVVALKKVRFDTSEPESVKFMAREIMIMQKLDHPNVLKLEGLATSRMQYSLYLVFEFMHSDLARVICRPEGGLTEAQVKCYMFQLLSGLEHCHERGILHRDIKGSNLLIDKNGMLKIGDFGLANYYAPKNKRPLTSRVVTLWYRAPELLLGATNYGVGIDLWSAGCLLAEMFAGRPIMPGRTEVEQLHRIFKLCGTPSEEYWRKLKLSTTFRPPQAYKPSLMQAFRDFPSSSLGLLSTLMALDPAYRGSATSALQNEFFSTSPLACDLSGLPLMSTQDDEQTQANDLRKQRNPKMKQRSRTQRERRRRDPTVEKSKEDLDLAKEVTVPIQNGGGSTSSTSSGNEATRRTGSSLFLVSPGCPNGKNNINNIPPVPVPTSKTRTTTYIKDNNNAYRMNQVNRSVSTREFRKTNQIRHLELHATDD